MYVHAWRRVLKIMGLNSYMRYGFSLDIMSWVL